MYADPRRGVGALDTASAPAGGDRSAAGGALPSGVLEVSMGLFDWLKPKPRRRTCEAISRELSEAVFAMHPWADGEVVVHLGRSAVSAFEVRKLTLDSARRPEDVGALTARIGQLVAELRQGQPVTDRSLTVMRDRVIWMPCVFPFEPRGRGLA